MCLSSRETKNYRAVQIEIFPNRIITPFFIVERRRVIFGASHAVGGLLLGSAGGKKCQLCFLELPALRGI